MRADRLLAIMLLLQAGGKTTTCCLAERLEVSRRTILRDLDALCSAGVPIVAEGGHGGGVSLDERYRATLAGMQEGEIRTLFVGDNAALLRELGLDGAAERTLLKLRAILPAAHRPAVEHLRQRLLIDPTWWWRDAQPLPWWPDLQRAVEEDRLLAAVYERGDGQVVERTLAPYSLVAKSSFWYLVAERDGELRAYRVARFRRLRLLDETFCRRPDFDLPAFWRDQLARFGELAEGYACTLRIHPEWLGFAQRIVPGRYRQLGEPCERGWLTLALRLESLELARMLVCGFGRHALVVEPDELRRAVAATAHELLATHATDD
ncbi:MAG TPA: WYL domain-containing protein [Herpetosiphonaceae bacterium]